MGRYDHKFLNGDVDDFQKINPTTENLTRAIWNHLEPKIPAPAKLFRVVVKETDRNFFEYYGEKGRVVSKRELSRHAVRLFTLRTSANN